MKKSILCFLILLIPTACSSTLPAVTPPPLPTLNPNLPPECAQYNPAIAPVYYADFSDGACDNAVLSADQSQIAYAALIQDQAGEITRQLQLYDIATGAITPVYTAQCVILQPEWTNGLLVISDTPLDLGCGFTAVYDPAGQKILAEMDGTARTLWADGWNPDHSAFFTLSPDDFGPVCAESLAAFDTVSRQPAPAIQPVSPGSEVYVVVGHPIWSADGKTLSAVLRDGVCTGQAAVDCTYSNAYILTIDFSQNPPALSRPYNDPQLDYALRVTDSGEMEISSSPSAPKNCAEITAREAH